MQLLRHLAIFFSVLLFSGIAIAQTAPLQMDEAFRPSLSRISATEVAVTWEIEPGYYLYREYLSAKSDDGSPLKLETPDGKIKEDPGFGSTEVYYDTARATLVSDASTIELTYQGCQDGGLCYPPVTKTIDMASLQFSNSEHGGPISAPASIASQSEWSAFSSQRPDFALAQDEVTTGVDGLLARGGLPLLLVGFVGFGVLLAFTPCVFPMYPIVAAMLSRQGGPLSPSRSFILSSVYVGALALAFGLFGIVAAWSGQNLQFALQSTTATMVIASLFVILALSNFGLFEIQLPAGFSNRLSSGGRRGGSLGGAAMLGFTSAFLIGPCVTAPLAGALLYIARTGDVLIGAAALFALGLGKGLPLILMATLGGKALPRAGAWMASIRSAFGFGFIGTAIWMVSPLLPETLVLFAWACLAVSVGVFLWQMRVVNASPGAAVISRSVATVSIAWGALLLVGVGLGARDPLAPLEPLTMKTEVRQAAREIAKSDFEAVASLQALTSMLGEASAENRPSLVYVTADWCVTCRAIERTVLPDDSVSAALDGARLLTIDMSATSSETNELLTSLNAIGPPTMIFFDHERQEVAGTRLVGDVTIEKLAASARAAKGTP
ncbi:protein-disulfide reductase DsbD [Agrobacterium sp. RAC06]|uniref:protein-disulfide reductase DsbD n=1 Tax=Agrobacterium sp. RAC06 TaxID=1842536 RepID=UPI00083E44B5|nr:protein-disulfide reductase DsbD [Agrobacterium sp. RAC06]AOG09123.1 cytochrome C biogenesis transmembrane region family protein [Agrobacterium sp. RAC06]